MQLEEEQPIYNDKNKPNELKKLEKSQKLPVEVPRGVSGLQLAGAHLAKLLHAAYNKLTPHPPRNERDVHSEKHLNITMPTHADR